MSPDRAALAAQAEQLRDLHLGPNPLILANAWDVASAMAIERAGAAAIATTSGGVAASLGYPDGEAIPVEEMLAAVARIAAAVEVPVTADLEAGYGLEPLALVEGLLDAGAVGMNLEDTDRTADPPGLVEADRQAERLAGVRRAATELGVPVVINARVDVFLRGSGPPATLVDEAIRRARAYRAAGADCLFPIWLTDIETIGRFVREVAAPVNVLLRAGAPSIATLAGLGVRRISTGSGLAHRVLADAEELARRLLDGDASPFVT